MDSMEQRVKVLEEKVRILEETFETLRKMQLSEQMDSYIKSRTRTLRIVELLNSVSDEPEFDLSKENESVAVISKRKQALDKEINCASEKIESVTEDLPCNPEYFDYEIESGIENVYGRTVNKVDLSSFVGKGIRITLYKGFDSKRITIPAEIDGLPVVSIGEKVFMNAPISEVVLPKTIKIIMRSAFEGCKNLKHINLPEGVEILRDDCFSKSGLIDISIPDNVRDIPERCFCLCENLKNVQVGNNVREIHTWAFWETAITALIVPKNVATVVHNLFSERQSSLEKPSIICVFLGEETEITIPDYETFNKVSLVYCLPGSRVQKIAREHNIFIKPLSEFRMEEYV